MAFHYYNEFPSRFSSRNFGDDINPFLLGKLFNQELRSRDDICVLGVGTILNDRNINLVSHFAKKVVFSSGVGYGKLTRQLDESWDVVCVRGPKTAAAVGAPDSAAICDGAVLLSDFFPPVPESQRQGIVFIPHIKTHWAAGQPLESAVRSLGWSYVTPDRPAEDFIQQVSSARMVVAEAMHGAILADTMRVPWLPVDLHEHNEFKWQDWFLSIDKPYFSRQIRPVLWNPDKRVWKRVLKGTYHKLKTNRVREALHDVIERSSTVLSDDQLLKEKKELLYGRIEYINRL